MRSTGAIFHQP
ncbi:hypothetical protein VULLAG_LOCUS10670 [Vulpes lagopus]